MNTVTIGDILNEAQIKQAVALYQEAKPGTFARRCRDEIIAPNITHINQKLGRENDPSYLAYAVEYALMKTSR